MKLFKQQTSEKVPNRLSRQPRSVIIAIFNPLGRVLGSDRVNPSDKLFWYVSIFGDWNDEWGYFSLTELESLKGPYGLGIERDLYFSPKKASQIIKKFYD